MWRPRRTGCGSACPRSKKARACRGVVMFGDESSFWLDGTLHVTWSRVGVQPRVDTFGERKTAHVYGAVSIERRPYFVYQFAKVFNGATFLDFLKELVRRCPRRKVFLIIDNGPLPPARCPRAAMARRASASRRAVPPPGVLARTQWHR